MIFYFIVIIQWHLKLKIISFYMQIDYYIVQLLRAYILYIHSEIDCLVSFIIRFVPY